MNNGIADIPLALEEGKSPLKSQQRRLVRASSLGFCLLPLGMATPRSASYRVDIYTEAIRIGKLTGKESMTARIYLSYTPIPSQHPLFLG